MDAEDPPHNTVISCISSLLVLLDIPSSNVALGGAGTTSMRLVISLRRPSLHSLALFTVWILQYTVSHGFTLNLEISLARTMCKIHRVV